MHMKRNLTIAALAAMIGVPALGSINANASNVQFGNVPATSNPSNVHVIGHNNQGLEFSVGNDPQEQIAGYGSPLERQMDQHNQSNNSQYSSKNSLPQTGEVNNKAESIAASIIVGSLGVGVAGLATKKRHREHNVDSTPKSSNNNQLDHILQQISNNTDKLNEYVNGIDY